MTRTRNWFRGAHGLIASWRNQRGEAVTAVLLLGAAVASLLAGVIAVAESTADRVHIAQCLQLIDTATQNLKQKYGTQGAAPLDDPDTTQIRACQTFVDQLVKSPTFGTNAATQNLAGAVNNALSGLGACTITSISPGAPTAGIDHILYVEANIPLTGTVATDNGSTITVAGTPLPLPMSRNAGASWEGFAVFSHPLSLAAGGTVTEVTVRAKSNIGRLSDGTCPSGTDASVPDKCIVTCTTPTKNVVWKNPPAPEIQVFLATPSTVLKGAPTPVALGWNVKNAKSISIDQGIGEVSATGSFIELPPDEDTTYTLTATGARLQDTKTATATVTVEKAPLVFLTAPGNNSTIPGTSVGVAGTVQDARPGDLVEIKVNGASRGTVAVSGGAFSTGVTLDKTLSLGDLTLSNPDTSVTSNGSTNIPVTLGNSKGRAETRNEITASVVGVPTSLDAVVVFTPVLVAQFKVEWLSCPPLNKNEPRSFELGAGQSVSVGTVSCGIPSGSGFCQTCTVRASARTSLGTVSSVATWVFNVQPCPAVSTLGY